MPSVLRAETLHVTLKLFPKKPLYNIQQGETPRVEQKAESCAPRTPAAETPASTQSCATGSQRLRSPATTTYRLGEQQPTWTEKYL